MTTRADVVSAARGWVGTRWHHQASSKGVGADCIGLVVGVARELGIYGAEEFAADPTIRGYGREPDPTMLLAACSRYLEPIHLPEARVGDILLLRFASEPQHFALISQTNPDYMLHAYAQARRIVENRIDAVWRSRIVRAYGYRGISG
jgi:NlpC/P60 family putative phage cell wall peptidase